MVNYPTIDRLMIENQINNDQNNHRHTQQPANNIFTYFHDTSPLPYSFNSCLIYGLWLTFKLAATRHHNVSFKKVYWKCFLVSVRCRTFEINCFICPDTDFFEIILTSFPRFFFQFPLNLPVIPPIHPQFLGKNWHFQLHIMCVTVPTAASLAAIVISRFLRSRYRLEACFLVEMTFPSLSVFIS